MEAGVEIEEDSIVQLKGVPQRFSYNELRKATGGFSKESILGRGGFGVVYQAELKSGIQVAIKRMNPEATQSQGRKEFKSEVEIIGQISHRNLIKLRGYCANGDRREYMLVYDLMPNGSLDDALFKALFFLSWPQKFKILAGAADGLAYLHQGLDQQVIHRDIKCSNILLDREYNAKLADFGIARMVAHQGRAATTDMAGTMGYMAPEVFSENQFTDKADVYAFGVVILEVACRRRVFSTPSHHMRLVEWVQFAHSKGNLLSTVDKRQSNDDTKQMKMVLKVGLLCTQRNPEDRPSMKHIVQMLAGDMKVPSVPTSKPADMKVLSIPTSKPGHMKVPSSMTSKPISALQPALSIMNIMKNISARSIMKVMETVGFYLRFWFPRRQEVSSQQTHSGTCTPTTPSPISERGKQDTPTSPSGEGRKQETHQGKEGVNKMKNVSYEKVIAHWSR